MVDVNADVDVVAVRLLLRRELMRNASHSPVSSLGVTTSSICVAAFALQHVDSLFDSNGNCVLLVPLLISCGEARGEQELEEDVTCNMESSIWGILYLLYMLLMLLSYL